MKMSNDLANIDIKTIDDRVIALSDLIKEITDEDIEHFTSTIGQKDDVPELQAFTAWTKSKKLILYTTVVGAYLGIYDRSN